MKTLIKILLITLIPFMVGCGWSEKQHQVLEDNVTFADSTEKVYESDSFYTRDAKGLPIRIWKDSVRYKNQPIVFVKVRPSRESVKQSFVGANRGILIGIGIVLILLGGVYFWYKSKNGDDSKGAVATTRPTLVLVIVGLALIIVPFANRTGNNDVFIKKSTYQELIKTDPNLIEYFKDRKNWIQ